MTTLGSTGSAMMAVASRVSCPSLMTSSADCTAAISPATSAQGFWLMRPAAGRAMCVSCSPSITQMPPPHARRISAARKASFGSW